MIKENIENAMCVLEAAVINYKTYLSTKTLSTIRDYINQLQCENEDLKKENKELKVKAEQPLINKIYSLYTNDSLTCQQYAILKEWLGE